MEVDYDRMWALYGDLDAQNPAAFHRHRLILELALTIPSEPSRIIDVGCGQGALVQRLGMLFPKALLYGGDSSPRALATSHARNPQAKHLFLDLADPLLKSKPGVGLDAFDLVVCSEVLEHIADERTAARHLYALTAPAGYVILTVPAGAMSRFDSAIGHHRHYSQASLERLLINTGFRIKRLYSWGFPFHSLYRAAVRGVSRVAMSVPREEKFRGKAAPDPLFLGLGTAYRLLVPILQRLFFLNSHRCGPQLVAMVQKA
jgi:SAM-dependent methyltransferase